MISRSFLRGFTDFAVAETVPSHAREPRRPTVIGRPPRFGFWLKRKTPPADEAELEARDKPDKA